MVAEAVRIVLQQYVETDSVHILIEAPKGSAHGYVVPKEDFLQALFDLGLDEVKMPGHPKLPTEFGLYVPKRYLDSIQEGVPIFRHSKFGWSRTDNTSCSHSLTRPEDFMTSFYGGLVKLIPEG